ncbi:hypothetical protein [Colwellia sp. 12G3]|uniref:hypothetical protein n=1 Tax=Colwellia sp. 12G3 TaxID=2058299 RepID=UPI000C340127|nr:hypothetical protein [Colwellia sp. 12G3]PKI16594.1 hypothetical protein CXF71_08305 [Colwellia sp. 12G3]
MNEHGSFSMKIVDRTLMVEAVGAWNLETAIRWGQEFKLLVSSIEELQWACLVDLSNFELAIPEVWEHLDSVNKWSNLHNQKYEAVVCSLSLQKVLIEKSHAALTNVETKFCEDLNEAFEWLEIMGVLKT